MNSVEEFGYEHILWIEKILGEAVATPVQEMLGKVFDIRKEFEDFDDAKKADIFIYLLGGFVNHFAPKGVMKYPDPE